MTGLVIGGVLVLLGLPFFVRGVLYRRRPDHPITQRALQRNLRLGLDTDMTRFGRRVRRFGFLLMAIGGAIALWSARSLSAG